MGCLEGCLTQMAGRYAGDSRVPAVTVPPVPGSLVTVARVADRREGKVDRADSSREPGAGWEIMIKVAVDAVGEAQARPIAEAVLLAMGVTSVGADAGPPPFAQMEDGSWVAEVRIEDREPAVPGQDDPMSVLSYHTANLGQVTWRGGTAPPGQPISADFGQMEWPAGYWAVAGRPETLVHPAVRAVLLQARRRS